MKSFNEKTPLISPPPSHEPNIQLVPETVIIQEKITVTPEEITNNPEYLKEKEQLLIYLEQKKQSVLQRHQAELERLEDTSGTEEQTLLKKHEEKLRIQKIEKKEKEECRTKKIPTSDEQKKLLAELEQASKPPLSVYLAKSGLFRYCLPPANKIHCVKEYHQKRTEDFANFVSQYLQVSKESIWKGNKLETALIKHAVSLKLSIAPYWDADKQDEKAEYTNVFFFVQNKQFSIGFRAYSQDDEYRRGNQLQYSESDIRRLAAVYNSFYGPSTATVEYDDTKGYNNYFRYLHLDKETLLKKILPAIALVKEAPVLQQSVHPDDIKVPHKSGAMPMTMK